MYALHAASALIGMFGSAFIASAFMFGLPSIIAVVMNYIRRDDARGTYLESHFSWQLRTFWFARCGSRSCSCCRCPCSSCWSGS